MCQPSPQSKPQRRRTVFSSAPTISAPSPSERRHRNVQKPRWCAHERRLSGGVLFWVCAGACVPVCRYYIIIGAFATRKEGNTSNRRLCSWLQELPLVPTKKKKTSETTTTRKKKRAPAWARTRNLSVNSRTRYRLRHRSMLPSSERSLQTYCGQEQTTVSSRPFEQRQHRNLTVRNTANQHGGRTNGPEEALWGLDAGHLQPR